MTIAELPNSQKEKIIQLLSGRHGLSAKQVYNRLKREFGVSVSYQAIHKTLKQMLEEKILAKKEKNYSINPEWVENFRKNAENLAEMVRNKTAELALENLEENGSTSISLKGIPQAGWFLIDKVLNGPNPEKKPCLALWRFCYSLVGLESKHLERLKDGLNKNRWIALVEENNSVDRMFGETLKMYGFEEIRFGVKCASKLSDKMIIADYVIEITYPSTFRKLWELQNKLPKKIAEFDLSKHFLLMREIQPQIEITITRNARLAQEYRNEYIKEKSKS